MSQPIVFISYSHKDETEKEALLAHLGALQREGLIKTWSDDQIGAGADWEQDIRQAIAKTKVAVLLVTSNFLKSDFIMKKEVPALLDRRDAGKLTVVPIIAKACPWKEISWLRKMNVKPKNGRPIWSDEGSRVNEDLAAIAEEIVKLIKTSRNPSTIFISYKRNSIPDEPLALHLREFLSQAGHTVFIDQTITIGVDWAAEIKRLISRSSFMIVLLSESSINSEMVAEEVDYTEDLPYGLTPYLDHLQYAAWRAEADTPHLTRQLFEAIDDIKAWQRPQRQPGPTIPSTETDPPHPNRRPTPVLLSCWTPRAERSGPNPNST